MSAAPPAKTEPASPTYTYVAVGLAALTSLGGLYLTLGEGKVPCPLCFYQRSFAFGTVGVLVAGLMLGLNRQVAVATLALPVAFAGLGVALYHVNLERTEVLECPAGMFGISTAPKQSAVLFGLLCAVLLVDAYQVGRLGSAYAHVLGGVGIGLALAAASLVANPKVPEPPSKPYPEGEPIKVCRPPYKAPAS